MTRWLLLIFAALLILSGVALPALFIVGIWVGGDLITNLYMTDFAVFVALLAAWLLVVTR